MANLLNLLFHIIVILLLGQLELSVKTRKTYFSIVIEQTIIGK